MKLLVWLLFSVLASPSYSCSCKGIDIKASAKSYKNVFVARVIGVKINSEKMHLKNVVARVEVLDSIKGNQKGLNYLYSGFGGGDCGLTLNVGYQYIIYSDSNLIHICSGSQVYPGRENDDGYVQALRDYIKSGKDFDSDKFFFVSASDCSGE